MSAVPLVDSSFCSQRSLQPAHSTAVKDVAAGEHQMGSGVQDGY